MEKYLKIGDRVTVYQNSGNILGIHAVSRVTKTQAVISVSGFREAKLRREYWGGELDEIGRERWSTLNYRLEKPGDAERLAERFNLNRISAMKWSEVPGEKIARILEILNEA